MVRKFNIEASDDEKNGLVNENNDSSE